MKEYICTIHAKAGPFLATIRIRSAASLQEAEEYALAMAGLSFRLGPNEMEVRKISERRAR